MLPFLLVLIAAQSALAAPSASVSFYNANQIDSPVDNGNLVNRYVISGPFDYLDVSDIPLYSNMMLQILGDLSIVPDSVAQTSAVIQTIATLGELTNGIPGDSCEAAGLINAFAYASSSGNNAGLAQALANFVQRLSNNIDSITQLIVNPSSARYSAGPRGNCLGGGRTYQFEEAWDAILSNSSPAASSLLNEEYCVARRMYNAFNIRSNNVGAAVTATNIPQVVQVAQYAVQYLTNFLRVVASGSNPSQAGAAAKSALAQGLAKVKC
ncbi:fibroin light chain-like [Leptidea sinapis]|uniref:fibroin light chain-like n=1 Tax=Leptidea sinapis TaxID=189913 RepID=UPI00214125FF|nr:fibroin light chain-like [Leptidea sinapis]